MRVVAVNPIGPELLQQVRAWQQLHGIDPLADETWIEVQCGDDQAFAPNEQQLLIALPAVNIAVDEELDPSGGHRLGVRLPQGPDEGVPFVLAAASGCSRDNSTWRTETVIPELPAEALFSTDEARHFHDVMKAVRSGFEAGAVLLSSQGDGAVSISAVGAGEMVATSGVLAETARGFAFALVGGSTLTVMQTARNSDRLEVQYTGNTLVLRNDWGEQRCVWADPVPTPLMVPDDYFVTQAQGRVEGLRIEREGGLGPDALRKLAEAGPAGQVWIWVDEEQRLNIGSSEGDREPSIVPGPSFTTLDGRRNVRIALPYDIARSIEAAAKRGIVELTIDDRRGYAFGYTPAIRIDWPRAG